MRWPVMILALLLLIDVWYRAHTFGPDIRSVTGINFWPTTTGESEPLDCDEAAYAYIGHRIHQGDVMYRDLTENKPPLGYWLYTLAVAIGGYRELAIRLMAIPFVELTIIVVWWIALRLGGPVAACLAAGLYALLSTDPFLFGNGSNFEHFINLFAVLSLGLLVNGQARESRWWIFGTGACLGLAALVKQVAIVPVVVFIPAILLRAWLHESARTRRWARGLLDVLVLGLGVTAVVGIATSIVMAQGAAGAAYQDIILQGRALATDTLPEPNAPLWPIRWLTGNADPQGRLPWPFGDTDYLVWWGSGSWPLWLASIPALAYLFFSKPAHAGRLLATGWTGAAWIQVALPGLYWQHYYLLPIPGVAIAVAVMMADSASVLARGLRSGPGTASDTISARRRSTRGRLLVAAGSTVALVAAIGGTLFIQARDYLGVAPEQLTIRYKGGGQWVVLRAMGRDLARRATIWNHPHLLVWGWQSPLYFYSRLDSPTRHFFVNNLLRDQADRNHPLVQAQTDEIMATLHRNPPELIFAGYAPFQALHAFLSKSYLPSRRVVHDERTAIGLWIRNDDYGRFEVPRLESRPFHGDSDQHLAEVLAAQESDQGAWGVLQAVDDVLAVLDSPLSHHRPDLGQEVRLLLRKVEHDEPAQRQPLDQDLSHQHRDPIAADRRLCGVVLRDEPADRHSCERVEEWQNGVEDGTADVLEIDVDSLRAGGFQRLGEIRPSVVDACVEPELLYDILALALAAGNPDRPASPGLGELAHNRANRTRSCGDHDGLAGFRLPDVHQAGPGGHSRHPEHAQRRRDGCDRRIELPDASAVGKRRLLPSRVGFNNVADAELAEIGGFDPADRAAGHRLADLDRRGIRRTGVHPASHVGVQREIQRAQQHLPRSGFRHRRLNEPEVGFLRLTLGASRQQDPAIHAIRHHAFLRSCRMMTHGSRIEISRRTRPSSYVSGGGKHYRVV
jgi:4-amino-4-deoxy-L-arabinose transferase-like glycosyltransferase